MTRVPGRATRSLRARRTGPRIGVFGGSFDPPHHGHLALAEWARLELGLDQVVFVPAGQPPHKRAGVLSAVHHRVALTRLAVRGNAAFSVSTIEARRAGPSYTADTLAALAAVWPGATLHLLMGADMFATFDSWREPAAIAARAVLVVAGRPGSARRIVSREAKRGLGVVWLTNPGLEVSSSELRARIARGLGARYLVPEA
ncbi:MAG: nicotinate-nucleotide adenylyltransferase, partial [Candidatus Eisenbacteria bacterium]